MPTSGGGLVAVALMPESFEPQKLFIGLVDFFSTIMPGALLTYLGRRWVSGTGYAWAARSLDSSESWMVFLFVSYLLGHFVFLLGARLDDLLYDPLRRKTTLGQISRLSRGKQRSGRWIRAIARSRFLFGPTADAAVMDVVRLKSRAMQGVATDSAVNAFQWCKARLSRDHTEGLVAVQRLEADSKFFRSFVVVLGILAGVSVARGARAEAGVCVALGALALWRYVDQRFKATQQAYWLVLTLESLKESGTATRATPARGALSHAGGVVFRYTEDATEYLLVEASGNRSQWVLPKGHIEAGENPCETAVREVYEESGHWATLCRWLQDVPLGDEPGAPIVRFYLMETDGSDPEIAGKQGWPPENRQQEWLTLPHAEKRATFGEAKRLLAEADHIRRTQFPRARGAELSVRATTH